MIAEIELGSYVYEMLRLMAEKAGVSVEEMIVSFFCPEGALHLPAAEGGEG